MDVSEVDKFLGIILLVAIVVCAWVFMPPVFGAACCIGLVLLISGLMFMKMLTG